jgi:probable HAF family extracellular repeat protein
MGNSTLAIKLVAIALVAVFSQNAHAQQYTLTRIPFPNLSSYPPSANVSGAYVIGYGLNNGGEVVGNVGGVIGNAPVQPFVYQQGSSQLLPYLATPEDYATASAINLNGIIVGESSNAGLGVGNAVSWQGGVLTDLGSLYYQSNIPAQSSAAAVNSKGDAVGSAVVEAGTGNSITFTTHAALYSGGAVTDLGTLGGNSSEALGISDSGVIVGDAQLPLVQVQGGYPSHAFAYDGTLHDLGVLPGGFSSSATAINASGTIVGWSGLSGGTHAVVWATPGGTGNYAIQDLGSLGPLAGNYSRANAINSSGQIVGISDTPQNGQTAFIYNNGVMTDLTALLPTGSSVILHEATAINDSGQIVAYSLNYATNVRTSYLLTPNTPPVTVPNVVGVTQTVASSTIAAADLEVGTVTIQNNGTVPAGVVISQTPAAGTSLRVGAPVNLVVSSGKVSVPNVIGLANATATSLLTSAGLTVTVSYQYSATMSGTTPSITVFQESPQVGTLVAQGSAVNVVFLTPLFITVPNLIGLSVDNFQLSAAQCAAHISLIEISYQSSPTVPVGTVISQHPVAGTIFGISGLTSYPNCPSSLNATVVNVVASSGPLLVMVPNVVGVTQAVATTLITTPGLVVGSVTTQPSGTVPSGSVLSQSPAAGTGVPSGGPVNLVVSSGPPTISIVLGGGPVYTNSATGWSVTVPLKNTGNVTAQTVQESSATLNGSPSARAIPSITLAPGATAKIVLNFPSAAVGTTATLLISGSYSGTSLSGSWSVGARAQISLP